MQETYAPRRRPVFEEYRVRGLRHHVTRWPGRDPKPIVLLHGFLDCGETFQFLADALDDRWTLVAPDWRGFGKSEWPVDGYWFPDYYADLEALLEQFSPHEPVTLVGHSMGGNIATLYSGIRHERVRRVVCIEGFGLPRTTPDRAPIRVREWLRQLHEPLGFSSFPSFDEFARMLQRRNPRLGPDRARFIAAAWATVAQDGSVKVSADPAHKRVNPVLYRREEAEACWREITAPVLYVIAAESDFLPRLGLDGSVDSMARVIRDLRPCVIEGASHMVHHEQPEALARAIEAFFAETASL
jgi:pimeloyl-ACP methyl ester carboxylesterase